MEQGEYLYIIGLGNAEDWEAGRGSIYYIEDRNGERRIPVFTTYEKLQEYAAANLDNPTVYLTMLESVGATHAAPLVADRFVVMPLDANGVAQAAALADAAYLVRDPRPGERQEVLRLDR